MKLVEKCEWFKLVSPIGEPDIKYHEKEYFIERVVKTDGSIVWFGQNTNWKKELNSGWTFLGDDENVKPKEIYYRKDGTIDGYLYPEGRQIWIDCETPIYEKMYIENYETFKRI